MIAKKTPSGIGYLEHYNGPDKPLKIYLHGDGQSGNGTSDLEKLKKVAFYTKFFNSNPDKFNYLLPQYPASQHGWGDLGVDFFKFARDAYKYDGREYLSGHSSGGKGTMYLISKFNEGGVKLPTAVAVIAGEADYKATIPLVGLMPIKLYVGSNDRTITSQDGKTIYQKMQSIHLWLNQTSEWREFPGVGHGSDNNAYDPSEGLANWFLSKGKPVEPPTEIKDPVVESYWNGSKLVVITESGLKKELTPD